MWRRYFYPRNTYVRPLTSLLFGGRAYGEARWEAKNSCRFLGLCPFTHQAHGSAALLSTSNQRSPRSIHARFQGESASVQAVFAILFGAAVVIAVGLWSRSAAMDRKANSCKMTMSRPDYVHLPVPGYPRVGEETPEQKDEIPGYQYRLVRYIDGKLPAYDKRNPSKPRGIPVLFVPGHLGNFKQV